MWDKVGLVCVATCVRLQICLHLFFSFFFLFFWIINVAVFFVRAMSLLRNAAQSNHAKLVVSRDAQTRLVYAYCTYIIAFNNVILRIWTVLSTLNTSGQLSPLGISLLYVSMTLIFTVNKFYGCCASFKTSVPTPLTLYTILNFPMQQFNHTVSF